MGNYAFYHEYRPGCHPLLLFTGSASLRGENRKGRSRFGVGDKLSPGDKPGNDFYNRLLVRPAEDTSA